ncbi:MAG TPA: GNAT family N-acetyltransferase [Bacillaceae bacterium]
MVIRKAEVTDAEGIAKVHVDCWRTTYKQIVPDEVLDNLTYERRTQLWIHNISCEDSYVFVAENDKGDIIGFSCGEREKTGNYPGFEGDVTSIYILEEHQGRNIGKALIRELFHQFQSIEVYSVLVWVLEKNKSRLFYERMGAELVADNQTVRIGEAELALWGYGWRDIRKLYEFA